MYVWLWRHEIYLCVIKFILIWLFHVLEIKFEATGFYPSLEDDMFDLINRQ